jgi:hypothetical protein
MPIVPRKSAAASAAAALMLLASPAQSQVNPLAGDTRPPDAPTAPTPPNSSGLARFPAEVRGKLVPSPPDGVVWVDELGWYGFRMEAAGVTSLDGTMRKFQFTAAGQPATCFAVRVVNDAFAKFPMAQIQAEVETLYNAFDASVTTNGSVIEQRKSLLLESNAQNGLPPLRVLGWDTRDSNGSQIVYSVTPAPAGQLMFACLVPEMPDVAREVIERFLVIGDGMAVVK